MILYKYINTHNSITLQYDHAVAEYRMINNNSLICYLESSINQNYTNTVAGPGFLVGGGVDLVGAAWTPEAATFRKICMSKRKNRSLRGYARRVRPLDSPMEFKTWIV